MKKNIIIIAAIICSTVAASAQTLAIYTKNLTVYANPQEVGEMVFDGDNLSIGEQVFQLTDIDSMKYLTGNFDPQVIAYNYQGDKCVVATPLKLMEQVSFDIDGAYVTTTSLATADPEIIYTLSGNTSNGDFILNGEYKCGVQLNGVNITSQRGAALHIKNGKRIDIETVSNTVNSFSDYYNGAQDACFQVKGHPEFKGNGIINITGNAKHGYKSGEYTLFKRSMGQFNILASVSDGMHVGQYFEMRGGQLTMKPTVLGDGLQVEKTTTATDELNGFCMIDSGSVSINIPSNQVSAIKCDSDLVIRGGQIDLTASGKAARGFDVGHNADISALYASKAPKLTLTASGGYLTIDGDKKKSSCFKTGNDLLFHAGTMTLNPSGDKAKGLKVGNDFGYVPLTTNVTMTFISTYVDAAGATRVLAQ